MSEEWFTGKNPIWMHDYMGLNRWYASERRYRLLVAGILRRFWPLVKDERSRKMVVAIEDFADRQISNRMLLSARDSAAKVDDRGERGWLANLIASAGWDAYDCGFFQSGILINQVVETFSHTRQIADVFRDVVQYRGMEGEYIPYTRPQSWRTKQVKLLARAAYDARVGMRCPENCVQLEYDGHHKLYDSGGPESRWHVCDGCNGTGKIDNGRLDLEHLLILSDAMEEAGCSSRAALEHLRSPGPHVRGCWAIDFAMGRT